MRSRRSQNGVPRDDVQQAGARALNPCAKQWTLRAVVHDTRQATRVGVLAMGLVYRLRAASWGGATMAPPWVQGEAPAAASIGQLAQANARREMCKQPSSRLTPISASPPRAVDVQSPLPAPTREVFERLRFSAGAPAAQGCSRAASSRLALLLPQACAARAGRATCGRRHPLASSLAVAHVRARHLGSSRHLVAHDLVVAAELRIRGQVAGGAVSRGEARSACCAHLRCQQLARTVCGRIACHARAG